MSILGKVLGVVAIIIILGLLFTIPIQLLWNWLMPELFGMKSVTFWQAMGLAFLSGLLFRSSSSSK